MVTSRAAEDVALLVVTVSEQPEPLTRRGDCQVVPDVGDFTLA
jgi:hypothetical protein